MKRKREQEPFFDDENGRCHLLEAVREMRAHICSFLVPDPADLAHLAQTCKVFEKQLVREQTGLLYLPWHWYREISRMKYSHKSTAFSRKCARDFLLAKSTLHVFDGLKGAQAFVRLEVNFVDATRITFRVERSCNFVFVFQQLPTFPTAVEIAAMREKAKARHAQKLERERRNRKIPAEVRKERAQLKTERSELKRTLVDMARKMRGYSCAGPHQLPAYIKISQRFVDAGKRHQEVVARLEEIDGNVEEEEEEDDN
jgi:hypothetical protein